jgi:disulfide bond formation protein DsbB
MPTNMVDTVIRLLAILTLLLDISLVIFIVSFIFKPLNKKFRRLLKGREVGLSFLFATTSTLGSLFLSEIAKYAPCELCWFQRIFMYPLAVVLGVALFKKAKDVEKYAIPLSFIGGAVSTYHYYLQRAANPYAPCSTIGFSVSCTEKFFTYYGYITIPFMALTGFVAIFLLMLLKARRL